MMMKNKIYFVFVVGFFIIMTSWFIYPRYNLYRYLKESNDIDDFQNFCSTIELNFLNYYYAYYQYPESSEDSIFRLPLYAAYGRLPYIYTRGVFTREDTITLSNSSIGNAMKLYLKGPNHNEKRIGQIINPIDHKNQIITPVNMPFYKFLFAKGDILIGVILERNPCDYSFSQNFSYKEKLNVHDSIVGDSFRRAILHPYREKYGMTPIYVRDFYDDAAVICYEANLHTDTLILTQKCEPFNGEYDTSPMIEVINKPLYEWAKEIGLRQFFFSIAVRPSFFEKK